MNNIKRVLLVNPFGLGDCLFLSPVLRALRKEGKVERIVLLVGSRTAELFQNHPFVDEVIAISRDEIRSRGLWKNFLFLSSLIVRLRRGHFDALIDVSLSREYAFFAKYFLGIPKRVGFDYHRRGVFLSEKIALPEGYRQKHVIEHYVDLLRPLGLEAKTRKPEIFLSHEEIEQAKKYLEKEGIPPGEPFVVLVPGGGESWGRDARFKRWPVEYFCELIRNISPSGPSKHVVVLGSAQEAPLGKTGAESLSLMGFHVVEATGKLALRLSLSVLSLASCVFTNDGGLCHAARALERPIVAVFGPVPPEVYGPYPEAGNVIVVRRRDLACQPCYKSFRYNASCQTIECLQDLTPEMVMEQISCQLDRFLN
ncbi:MAG: glycosyltransferase family 9 protein [Candidatus Omnitrophica bacterium]|nr:glycosyltransferase family 9 protein [Candidatus Omnitrophota bacterium]